MKYIAMLLAAAIPLCAAQRSNPYEGHPQAARAGEKLYRRYCAGCHGATAEGIGRRPSLRPAAKLPPSALFGILTNGVMRRGMPSWSRLPAQQRWQIITYIRTLGASPKR